MYLVNIRFSPKDLVYSLFVYLLILFASALAAYLCQQICTFASPVGCPEKSITVSNLIYSKIPFSVGVWL